MAKKILFIRPFLYITMCTALYIKLPIVNLPYLKLSSILEVYDVSWKCFPSFHTETSIAKPSPSPHFPSFVTHTVSRDIVKFLDDVHYDLVDCENSIKCNVKSQPGERQRMRKNPLNPFEAGKCVSVDVFDRCNIVIRVCLRCKYRDSW